MFSSPTLSSTLICTYVTSTLNELHLLTIQSMKAILSIHINRQPSFHITYTYLASRSSWNIDLGALLHMNGTPSIISSLTLTTTYPLSSIIDGFSCSIKGCGLKKTSFSLTLLVGLYVLDFPTSPLFNNTITHTLKYDVLF